MKIKGYYNNSCKICRAEINHYKKINKTIDWTDVITDKNVIFETKISKKDLIRRMHIKKNDRVFRGIDAFLVIWEEIPRYRFLAQFVRLPLIYHFGWLIYEFIAIILYYKNRYLLNE